MNTWNSELYLKHLCAFIHFIFKLYWSVKAWLLLVYCDCVHPQHRAGHEQVTTTNDDFIQQVNSS